MVASFNPGTLVTSYVRVPGSGTDKTIKSVLYDLSRVSRIVTPISLQSESGLTVINSTAKPVPIQNEKGFTAVPSTMINSLEEQVSETRKRPKEDENDHSSCHKKKRQCIYHLKPSTEVTSSKIVDPQLRNVNNIKVVPVSLNNILQQNKDPLVQIQVSTLNQLLIQNNQLEQENTVLKRQVSLFKQLIMNPKRLNSVLNKLNVLKE